MSIFEIIILSFALALDAMLVSFSYGLIINKNRLNNSLKLACSFGFFQFFMPVLGWWLTGYVYNYLKIYSKWIVFIVFLILGFKFLKEAFSQEDDELQNECISLACLLCLAIATSIDALGAGVSIKFLNTSIILPSVLIGLITSVLSIIGFFMACIFNFIGKKYIEIVGAVLLMYLAVKALV